MPLRSAFDPGRVRRLLPRLIVVEHLGDQTRLHLRLDGHEIVTLIDPDTDLEPGDSLAIEPRNPLYFDAAGGRIDRGDRR